MVHDAFPPFPTKKKKKSGTFGVIQAARAPSTSDDTSSDFVVSLTLSNKQRVALFLLVMSRTCREIRVIS